MADKGARSAWLGPTWLVLRWARFGLVYIQKLLFSSIYDHSFGYISHSSITEIYRQFRDLSETSCQLYVVRE